MSLHTNKSVEKIGEIIHRVRQGRVSSVYLVRRIPDTASAQLEVTKPADDADLLCEMLAQGFEPKVVINKP